MPKEVYSASIDDTSLEMTIHKYHVKQEVTTNNYNLWNVGNTIFWPSLTKREDLSLISIYWI